MGLSPANQPVYNERVYQLHHCRRRWFAYKAFATKKPGEDGEINNQRKAFLDVLAWSEELITDVRKPEIMVPIL